MWWLAVVIGIIALLIVGASVLLIGGAAILILLRANEPYDEEV